ncbi:hypothetical protein TTHERM_00011600 (macronuclear) [Tetrahymena thermophila SB210]|uniref:Uncharacterized protein n=1 Tax=Tetrahymena thermophila (strain SB210) TaxID=312017 RepID=Q22RX8_TETTS|nr:hypothetical protein TTHERM_00011600 [Tetrahymena thermophila SB210]EAR87994.1 hypothetical protein TTHERM_00011600 [Tetrahymena thermophila SB210]|eukprot:XP_001008239.1 hypothetical protein TTHERM_00011600 [Tetrahymena thermophila SB210]
MLTQRINDQAQSVSQNRGVGNMRVNLNSVNPYFQYETISKGVKDERLGNNYKYTQNSLQNYSMNDMDIHRVSNANKINLQSNDLLQYKKLLPPNQTERTYTNTSSLSIPLNNISQQADQRRSDQMLAIPSIVCFNCSTALHLNELKQHHADRCVRENPQIDGLDLNKALKQIDNKLERINAYFASLLKEQKLLEIKERRALVLKEVIQRALHCDNQSIFTQLQTELEQEFPSSFSQILSDYLSCHAHQIKNIIKLKLSVLSNTCKSTSPLKLNTSNNNFYLLQNFNSALPSQSQRVQSEATPRNLVLNNTEMNIQKPTFSDQGFLSPQSNSKQLQGILKKPEVNVNADSKNLNLFNKYLSNQLQTIVNVQKNEIKNDNQKGNTKSISQPNQSAVNLESNSSASYYLLSQSNANLNQVNNFSTTQQNIKYIPTFQINLNQQNINNNQSISNPASSSRNNLNVKDTSNNQSKILQEYYQNQQTPANQNALSLSTLNQNNNSINSNQLTQMNGLNSPQRFTFANNQSQTFQNTIDTTNSPYLLINQPSFSTQISNNGSQSASLAEKTSMGQQQLFFPPQLHLKQNSYEYTSNNSTKQSLSTNTPSSYQNKNTENNNNSNSNINIYSSRLVMQNQQRSVSPQFNLAQQSLQNQHDEKIKNYLLTDRMADKLSSPQNNLLYPKPYFNSPQAFNNNQQELVLKNITQNDQQQQQQQQGRSFKSQRILNFDIKDLGKINVEPKANNFEESVKKSLNSNNCSTYQTSISTDQVSSQSISLSKNELINKLMKKQKDLQNLQLLSQQLKSTYESHQEDLNKVYSINQFSKSKSPNPSQRQQVSHNSSIANYNNENIQSILLKQQISSNSNSTEITQILSPGYVGSMNEILSEEDKNLQSIFYNICLTEKMNIPKNHLAHKLPISLLFKEALEMNIKGEEQMRYFIQYAFENATTYIDIDKLKKSNKNQIFKNNLANKLLTQLNQ